VPRSGHRRVRVRWVTPFGDETGLHAVALLDAFGAVPETSAAAERNRHLDNVEGVDEVGGQEAADDRRATADAHVEVTGDLPGEVEYFPRRGVDEVEDGADLHLDRRATRGAPARTPACGMAGPAAPTSHATRRRCRGQSTGLSAHRIYPGP
jgi:hypothetical protein